MEEAVRAFRRVVRILDDARQISRRRIDEVVRNAIRPASQAAASRAVGAAVVTVVAVDDVPLGPRRTVVGLLTASDLGLANLGLSDLGPLAAASDGERQAGGHERERKQRCTHLIVPPKSGLVFDGGPRRLFWIGVAAWNQAAPWKTYRRNERHFVQNPQAKYDRHARFDRSTLQIPPNRDKFTPGAAEKRHQGILMP